MAFKYLHEPSGSSLEVKIMRIKFLSTDNTIKLAIVGFIFFVLLGDVLLPEPLKSASKNTKSAIKISVFLLIMVMNQSFFTVN